MKLLDRAKMRDPRSPNTSFLLPPRLFALDHGHQIH
jgi:hypothetical protein